MSKELPYFRFYSSEWLEGNITLENERTQGLFIQICAWYWKKDCQTDLQFISKRLINGKAMLKQCLNNLLESNIIKVDENEMITIDFLDEQYLYLEGKRNKLVEAGRIGGKAMLKQRLSYNNKDKDNNKNKNKDKDKKKFIPPSLIEIKEYFKEEGYKEDIAEKAWKGYDVANWVDSKGNKIRNWKQKCIHVWFKDEYKIVKTDSDWDKRVEEANKNLKKKEDEQQGS